MKIANSLIVTLSILLFPLAPLFGICFTQNLPASQKKPLSLEKSNTFALVVGVSNYQDAEIPDLKYAQRDAEAFAAFLQSPAGGQIPKENITLLTNSEVTNARLSLALDWLFEQSIVADKVIIYLAGYGDTDVTGKQTPSYFLAADSPLTPLQAGAFRLSQIAQVIDNIFYKRKPDFLLVANLFPLILSPGIGYQSVKMEEEDKVIFSNCFSRKFIEPTDQQKSLEQIHQARFTLNNLLLDGLLGFADKNKDEEVSYWEMKKFLRKAAPVKQRWPGLLFLAAGTTKERFAEVDRATLKKLSLHSDQSFPSIIHLETSEKEDKILENVPEHVHLTYQDFILTIKLGQLLEPKDRCASYFYEQLRAEPILAKLHGDMRRKLAAALQDEVQQALNAYLKLDNSELERRNRNAKAYQLYTDYMARSIELLGARNFMKNIMQAKYHYFSGLVARIQAVINGQPELLDTAIAEQNKALHYESTASFIYNELGVIYVYQGEYELAIQQFELASEYSPNWSIPYSNLCTVWIRKGDFEQAIIYGKKAFRLSPKNELVTSTLASAYLQSGDLYGAAKLYNIVLEKDPDNIPALYDLACIHTLLGQTDAAFSLLDQTLEKGYKEYDRLQSDPDFTSLRKQKEQWHRLMKKYFPSHNND